MPSFCVCVNILPVCKDGQLMCAQCSRILDKTPELELELQSWDTVWVLGAELGSSAWHQALVRAETFL